MNLTLILCIRTFYNLHVIYLLKKLIKSFFIDHQITSVPQICTESVDYYNENKAMARISCYKNNVAKIYCMPFNYQVIIKDFDCFSKNNLPLVVECYKDWIVIGSREPSYRGGWCMYSVLIGSGYIKNKWINDYSPETKATQYQWYKVCHVLFQ